MQLPCTTGAKWQWKFLQLMTNEGKVQKVSFLAWEDCFSLEKVFCKNLHWKFLLLSGWVKMYIGNWITSKFEVKIDSVTRFSSKMWFWRWSWTYISVYNEETGELQMFCFSFLEVCRQGNSFPSISSLASSVGKQNLQGKHFGSSNRKMDYNI